MQKKEIRLITSKGIPMTVKLKNGLNEIAMQIYVNEKALSNAPILIRPSNDEIDEDYATRFEDGCIVIFTKYFSRFKEGKITEEELIAIFHEIIHYLFVFPRYSTIELLFLHIRGIFGNLMRFDNFIEDASSIPILKEYFDEERVIQILNPRKTIENAKSFIEYLLERTLEICKGNEIAEKFLDKSKELLKNFSLPSTDLECIVESAFSDDWINIVAELLRFYTVIDYFLFISFSNVNFTNIIFLKLLEIYNEIDKSPEKLNEAYQEAIKNYQQIASMHKQLGTLEFINQLLQEEDDPFQRLRLLLEKQRVEAILKHAKD